MAKLHTSFAGPAMPVSQVDQDIDRFITAHADRNFDEVLEEENRWQVFFQLTDLRAGLFGWYEMPPDADVLEIGAGFGALTGILCEKAAHVTVTERALFRARAITKRYADYTNLDVYAGDLPDLHFVRKYDVIVLTGFLSIVGDGSSDEEPYISYLKSLQAYLKSDGRILIAVDNRFGLKYFCGARDPYRHEPFGELSGAQGKGHLFTHHELSDIVRAAGYSQQKFYYPLPDYRIPQVVYTDAHLPGSDLHERLIPYDPSADTRVLPESELYDDILANGAFPFMANSFFVECGNGAEFCPVEYAVITADRGPQSSVVTSVIGHKKVCKKPLSAAGSGAIESLANNMAALAERGLETVPCRLEGDTLVMPYVEVPTLASYLQHLNSHDKDKVLAIFDRLWASILQSSAPAPDADNALLYMAEGADWGVILRQAYMEMMPMNTFYDDGKLIFFDQEFMRENYPAKYPMFRAVYYSYGYLDSIVSLDELKERYGLTGVWEALVNEEQEFIAATRRYNVYHQFYSWADMDRSRMLKNRQILKIIGNE